MTNWFLGEFGQIWLCYLTIKLHSFDHVGLKLLFLELFLLVRKFLLVYCYIIRVLSHWKSLSIERENKADTS